MAAHLPLALFTSVDRCWVCEDTNLASVHEERLDLRSLIQDPALQPILQDYHGYTFTLNRCRACQFIQPQVLPSHPKFFDTIYNINWPSDQMEVEFVSGCKDAIFHAILACLGRRLPGPERSLLDVGAHVGRMLHLARESGWRAEGIELNPRTAAFCARRTGLPVHRKNAVELVASGERFDAVVLTDVLEHIPRPVCVLRGLRELVKPGGWIAVKVPCGPNQLFKQRIRHRFDPRADPGIATNFVHVNHFGPRSLALALQRAGFDAMQIAVGAPELPPGRGLKEIAIRTIRTAVYTLARLLPLGTRTPLAFNLQAFARNPT